MSEDRQDVTDWLTLHEAAQVTGYVAGYLRRLVNDGRASAVKVGRQWFMSPEEAERLRQRREHLQDG